MPKSRFSLSAQTEKSTTFTLEAVDPEDLKATVVAVLKTGAAITLSFTKDKSSLSLSIIDNGQVQRAYAADIAELEVLMESIQLQASVL